LPLLAAFRRFPLPLLLAFLSLHRGHVPPSCCQRPPLIASVALDSCACFSRLSPSLYFYRPPVAFPFPGDYRLSTVLITASTLLSFGCLLSLYSSNSFANFQIYFFLLTPSLSSSILSSERR
jgi:hypothetical protein